ncbi:hypothetical protein M0R45_030060 [Rubus argutus]|uniref:Transmembrane protein n=1 Tax=Rubus argutus TaxID=59490 RepID=A0AAW1WDT9_RUBAR
MDNNQRDEQLQEKKNLEKKKNKLETKMGEQDNRINYLQSSGFQLANFYFVFQGVILTAIANGNSALRCSDRWFLFILSILPAALNLVSLFIIGVRYNNSIFQREETSFQCDELQRKLSRLEISLSTQTRAQPQHFRNSEVDTRDPEFVPDTFAKLKRNVYLVICMVLFGGVAVVMIVGCWTILCRGAECKNHPSSGNDKCVRVCDGSNCINICSEY